MALDPVEKALRAAEREKERLELEAYKNATKKKYNRKITSNTNQFPKIEDQNNNPENNIADKKEVVQPVVEQPIKTEQAVTNTTITPEIKTEQPPAKPSHFGTKPKYNPMEGNAHERSHSTPKINTNVVAEIPEADFEMPNIDTTNLESTLDTKTIGGPLPNMDQPAGTTQSTTTPTAPGIVPTVGQSTLSPEEQFWRL